MTRRAIAVVAAGLSQPSSTQLLADRLAAATAEELTLAGAEVELRRIELRDLAHDVTNNLLTGFPAPRLAEAVRDVTSADGLIAVTPVYSASYSGLFKSFVDVLDDDALAGLPVLVAATGGTARHSLVLDHAMRPLFSHLQALVVPTGVYAAPEDWAGGTANGPLVARIERAAGELARQVTGRSASRRDPVDVTPFEELLAGG
jgi:FMN reductase